MTANNKAPSLCHIYAVEDPQKAYEALETELVKDYGETTHIKELGVERANYEWDEGYRCLVRCRHCGSLFLVQHSEAQMMDSDNDGSYTDWLPVFSGEEADGMNLLIDPSDFWDRPVKHLSKTNRTVIWRGDQQPHPMDIDEMQLAVAHKLKSMKTDR